MCSDYTTRRPTLQMWNVIACENGGQMHMELNCRGSVGGNGTHYIVVGCSFLFVCLLLCLLSPRAVVVHMKSKSTIKRKSKWKNEVENRITFRTEEWYLIISCIVYSNYTYFSMGIHFERVRVGTYSRTARRNRFSSSPKEGKRERERNSKREEKQNTSSP